MLKSLLPGLLPLIVYVAAVSFLGEAIGLAVGVGVGVVEFAVILIRDRKPDPFVAADTLLLVLVGAVSILSGNDLFFKLKPAFVELVFASSFALFLVLPPTYLRSWMERQLRGIEMPAAAIPAMRKSLIAMLAALGFHALLTVWAALFLSAAAWGFISGVLLYLLFGAVVLGEFVAARWKGRKLRSDLGASKGERLLPVVDGDGAVVGQAPERICHAGEGVLHPALRLMAVDGRGAVYLRRHAAGGAWDATLTRHVELGEDLAAALSRGIRESLGVAPLTLEAGGSSPQGALRYRRDEDGQSELVFVFYLPYGGPFALSADEGSEGRFFLPSDLEAAGGRGEIAPRFLREYSMIVHAARGMTAARGPDETPVEGE